MKALKLTLTGTEAKVSHKALGNLDHFGPELYPTLLSRSLVLSIRDDLEARIATKLRSEKIQMKIKVHEAIILVRALSLFQTEISLYSSTARSLLMRIEPQIP
ncbi:MAG: hypothetical protein AAFR61_15220 [Bacteroidota bacterium]